MTRVLVIGAGVAGVAAAWAARRAGAQVSLVSEPGGVSCLSSGAVDWAPWQLPSAGSIALPEDMAQFSAELGLWQLPPAGALVLSRQGLLRSARGADKSLLDLSRLAGREVGVVDVERSDWSAGPLCKLLNKLEAVRNLNIRFVSVRVPFLREAWEEQAPSVDLAALFDEPSRVEWLAEKLSRHGVDGWLFGPWLGLTRPAAPLIEERLRLPVGETLSDVGEAAGYRLDFALRHLCEGLGVELRAGRALSVQRAAGGAAGGLAWQVELGAPGRGLEPGSAEPTSKAGLFLSADAVVVATGGLGGGGLRLVPAARGELGGVRLDLNFRSDFLLQVEHGLLPPASSLHGLNVDALGARLFERAGLAWLGPGVSPGAAAWDDAAVLLSQQPSAFGAGDVLADRARTVLSAVHSGILAGQGAARANATGA